MISNIHYPNIHLKIVVAALSCLFMFMIPKAALAHQIDKPKIQLAILLDTSNSMDGLINQTRNQLWQVVNEFSTAKRDGVTPILEVALFEYGNDNNSRHTGFIRKLSGFTQELDSISEALFALTTNGGSEFCGFAINTATENLHWSTDDRDIKAIFIAGNEPFTQGPIHFRQAIQRAKNKGILVNTIHAGEYDQGVQGGWQQGALLAGGDYMSINTDQKVVHIESPHDTRIAELNIELNKTYIPYGVDGKVKARRQQKQDQLSDSISIGLLAKRAKTKSSSYYKNETWDLVDAMEKGIVTEEQLKTMDKDVLPAPMATLKDDERIDYVNSKTKERQKIKDEITQLSEQRESYIAEIEMASESPAPTISDALTESIKKQAEEKAFILEQ